MSDNRRAILSLAGALVLLHLVLALFGLWRDWAWPAIGVSFILLVLVIWAIVSVIFSSTSGGS